MRMIPMTGQFQRAVRHLLFCSIAMLAFSGTALALSGNTINACSDCHGTPYNPSDLVKYPGPADNRPLDASYRNISTGAVVGNHRTHIATLTTQVNICTPCHGLGVNSYQMDHRDGKIAMRQHINSTASIRGVYNKGTFINQTSAFNPTNATCSNVNCHFLKTTLTWGSAPYSYTSAAVNDCDQCHGNGTLSAPQDGSHPNTTNKHGLYYGYDALSCAKCHSDHTVEANRFSHATSAGNRALILNGTNLTSTSYSKAGTNLAYPTYMTNAPANRNGTCNNLYCHSPGTGGTKYADGRAVAAAAVAATWGGTVNCSSCHTGGTTTGPTYANGTPKANAHAVHTPYYTCDVCHYKTTNNGTTIASMPRHVDGYYNISANTTKTKQFNYTFAAAGGTCSKSSCHGQGTPAWNQTYNPTGGTCFQCHGSQTASYTNNSSATIAPGTGNMDTARNTGITPRGGAHQEHLNPSTLTTQKVKCNECHIVPTTLNSAPHLQYSTANLSFKGSSIAYSATPSTSRVSGIISCSNTHCHTGKLNSGNSMTPTWNSTSYISATAVVADCRKCHGLPPRKTFGHPSTAVLTAITGTNAFTLCVSCHNNLRLSPANSTPAGLFVDPSLHIDGTVGVNGHAFPYPGSVHRPGGTGSMLANAAPPYTNCNGCHNTTATSGPYPVTSGTAPICTACHKNSANFLGATPGCYDCHGSSATNGRPTGNVYPNYSGAHTKHAAGYKLMGCTECHANGGSGSAKHGSSGGVNSTGIAFVNVTSTTAAFHYTATGKGVCSNAYCHSNVQSSTGGAATRLTPSWGSKLNCAGCHGNNGTNLTSGSHALHLNAPYTYACSDCHGTAGGAANTAIHTDGAINVVLTNRGGAASTYTGDSVPANSNFGACSSTVCHGQRSPVWGATASSQQCTKCHGQANVAYPNLSSAIIAPGGAGRDTSGTNTAATFPRVGTHQQHLTASSKMSPAVHCGECHTVVTTVGAASHLNYTTATITFGPMAKGQLGTYSFTPSVARTTGGVINCNNTYCHMGGYRPAGTGSGQRGNVTTVWSFNGTSILDNSTITGTCASKCHGMPPGSGVAGDTHQTYSVVTTVSGLSACSSQNNGSAGTGCHPSIKSRAAGITNFTNLTSVFMSQGALHVNGIVEGGTCTGCHATTKGNRRSITGQFTSSRNSHHYQGPVAQLDGKVCYQCHWEANLDGSPNATYHKSGTSGAPIALVVRNGVTTRPTAASSATLQYYSSGGATASSRGAILKINRNCLGCHDNTNSANAMFPNDTGTPAKYSWEALPTNKGGLAGAAQSIASKYSDTATTLWGKFSGNYTNAKSGQTKAYSAHGNAATNQRGWATIAENTQSATAVANYPNTSGAVNVACFDCHNSHGSDAGAPANAVTTSYSSATGRGRGGILKTTVAGKGGYTVSYRPYTGGNVAQKNTYKTGAGLCFDCHNNASVGLATSAGSTTPWGHSATFGSTPKIHGYNDNPYFGKTGGTFARGTTYPYIGTGLPTNKGGHFGASSALTTTPNFRIGGLCTPCHDPHGVSGLLTNKQYSVPLLKESFITSPYKMDAANPNVNHGGGSKIAAISTASTAGYHIDQNTLQAAKSGATLTNSAYKGTGAIAWVFSTSATTLQTYTDTQFGQLCLKCHNKADINSTAAATSGNWKTMTRIHNSVKGWASTGGTNAGNTKHAYTCSKCHSAHNSNLPRLLVTNCLDANHKGRVASGGATAIGPFSGSNGSGNGLGRFPGGGAAATWSSKATSPGPWFFGPGPNVANTTTCHDTATAGGTTFNQTSQQWNTKSLW